MHLLKNYEASDEWEKHEFYTRAVKLKFLRALAPEGEFQALIGFGLNFMPRRDKQFPSRHHYSPRRTEQKSRPHHL
jgi:hypothetical protein